MGWKDLFGKTPKGAPEKSPNFTKKSRPEKVLPTDTGAVCVKRWFQDGQGLAFDSAIQSYTAHVFKGLSEIKRPQGVGTLLHFTSDDGSKHFYAIPRQESAKDCLDESGKHRNPYVAIIAMFEQPVPEALHDKLKDSLLTITPPAKPGKQPMPRIQLGNNQITVTPATINESYIG